MKNFVQLLNSMQPTHSANAVINVQLPEQYSSNTIPLNYSHQIVHKEKGGTTIEIPLQDFEVNPFIFFFGMILGGGGDGLPSGLKLEYPRALQKADFKKSDDIIQINNCNNYIEWQRTPEDWYYDENGNGIIPTQGIQYNHDLDSLTFIAVYKNNKFLYVGALLKMPYVAGDNTDNIQICIPVETLFTDNAPIKINQNNKSLFDVFPIPLILMLGTLGIDENERNGNIIKYDSPNLSSDKDLLYAYMRSTMEADGDKYRIDKETFLNEYFQEAHSSYLALIDSGLSPEEAIREIFNGLDVYTDNFPDLTNYDNFVEYSSHIIIESIESNSELQSMRFFSESIQNLFVNSMLYADTTQMCDKSKIHIPNYDSLFSDTYDDYDYENTGTQTPIEEDKSEYTFYPLYYNEIDFTKLEVPYYYQILTGGDYSNLNNLQAYFNKYQNTGEEIEPSFSLFLDWAKETLTFPLPEYDFNNIVTQICRSSQSPLEDNDNISIQYIDEYEDIQYIDNKFIQGLELFHYKDELTKQIDYYFTECELQGSKDFTIPYVGTLPHKKILDIQPFFEITESIMEELQNASETENDQILYKSSTSHMDEHQYKFTVDQSKFAQDIKTITFSSNSFIQFDQDVLNVNQRDGCAYELSYSYGTLSNGTQYIKLLFDGYSNWNKHTDDVKLRYVVFRLSDGRIILFMKNIPTNSSYMGTYSFNDTAFSVSANQPTILGPEGIITYDEPQYIIKRTNTESLGAESSSFNALITSQDQYVLKINDNNILTFNYEDCIERVSDNGEILLTYVNKEFQEYIVSVQQSNDSTEASNIPFPENGLCIQIMNGLALQLIGSINQITPNDKVIIERLTRNIIVSSPKIAPYYANKKHGEIFNDYNYNRADGKYSHAEGYHNTIYSSAHYSHIEGNDNIIVGVNGHCEGAKNRNMSNYSHAEGYETTVSGDYSHAEGSSTTASGDYSHAEGSSTTASGNYSHAEGSDTTASSLCSHAEGNNTKATSLYSHAEGYKTTASGVYSHAEGSDTTASGSYSHAEGYKATASGNYSHAEGYQTTASGNYSHTEGDNTNSNNYSNSHVEGIGTTAGNDYQHVQGKYNSIISDMAHVVGGGTSASERKNIHTLDWNGNAWFAGDVTAGVSGSSSYASLQKTAKIATANSDYIHVASILYNSALISSASKTTVYNMSNGAVSLHTSTGGVASLNTDNTYYYLVEMRSTSGLRVPVFKKIAYSETSEPSFSGGATFATAGKICTRETYAQAIANRDFSKMECTAASLIYAVDAESADKAYDDFILHLFKEVPHLS